MKGEQQHFGLSNRVEKQTTYAECNSFEWDEEERAYVRCGSEAVVRIEGGKALRHRCPRHSRVSWLIDTGQGEYVRD